MKYNAFNASERGYSHIVNGTVCQDASYSYADENSSIAVVADGHGSKQYCRSDRGAKLAVDCTVQVIEEFLASECLPELLYTYKRRIDILSKICNSIIAKWRLAIEADLSEKPFTDEELTDIPGDYAQDYREHKHIEKAYGTTLIAVFAVGEYCFGIQIGDGKCVALYADGSLDEPIPWDESCCFNVTTSLCDSEASQRFRFAEINNPAAVFIGTDGIDDTYGTGLFHFYLNTAKKIIELGYEEAVAQLKGYMSVISKGGSHDDVSLAGLVDVDGLLKLLPQIDNAIGLSKLELELQKLQQSLPDKLFRVQKEQTFLERSAETTEDDSTAQQNLENAKRDLQQQESMIAKLKKELENARKTANIEREKSDSNDETLKNTEGENGGAGNNCQMS